MGTKLLDTDITSYHPSSMMNYATNIANRPLIGDLIEAPVIGIVKMALYVDLKPYGTGVIYGREFINARDVIKKINVGDIITAKVVEVETPEDGYVGLSLKEARQALVWAEAENLIKNKTVLELTVKDANKGGIIMEWQNIAGFLPASQLKPEHYPRVNDGDKDRIMIELKKLIGQKIAVSIISANPKEGKLIFSEKSSVQKERVEMVEKYHVGDVLDGEVTGAVDFGIFVKLEDGLEGLVHISEIDWSLVENPKKLFNVGDKIKVKVIEIKDGKVSLSIKALKESPWKAAENKYKKGAKVNGVVIKYNKHGALVSIEEGVAGLVHISAFGTEDKMKQTLELGKSYNFIITLFEPKEQKMTLVLADSIKDEKPAETK
ncbi:MAG: S1 RNA-binding domain-containing protein [Candidatus Vogelbacteria bacterium]|nr:S1 RNA-binding domain-containing protein [Candidatus Vogelbacteria bacterium]